MRILGLLLIPLALQSYEEATAKLADDLSKAETATAKVGVADEYVKLLNKFPKKRQELLDAASDAYGKAWPDLDVFWKMKTRERLARLYLPKPPAQAGNFTDGWSGPVDGAHKISVSAERVHSGGGAAKLVPGAKARNARLLYTPTVVGKGKKVEFSLWILTDGTAADNDEIRFYLDGSISTRKIPKDLPVWSRISFEADTIGGSFERANIEVVIFSREGAVYVDDVSIKVDGKEQLKGGSFDR